MVLNINLFQRNKFLRSDLLWVVVQVVEKVADLVAVEKA